MKTKSLLKLGFFLTLTPAAFLSSCSQADLLDGNQWSCQTAADCTDGWVCNTNGNYCEESTSGTNGIFEDRLVLGISAAITNGPTELGIGMRDGIKAYFAEVNSAGGIHGRKLELVELDDGYVPDQALANTMELLGGGKVFSMIGNVGTPTAAVTVPYAVENRALFFGAFTGAGLLRNDPPDRYVFNYRASYKEETAAVVKYFTDEREDKVPPANVWVLPQGVDSDGNTDGFGQSGLDGVADYLSSAHGVKTADIGFWTYERNSVNVDPAVAKFLHWLGSPDRVLDGGSLRTAVVMIPTADPAAAFIEKVRAATSEIQNSEEGFTKTGFTSDELARIRASDNVLFSSVSFVGSNKLSTALGGAGTFNDASGKSTKYCDSVIITQTVPLYSSGASGVQNYRDALQAYDTNLSPGFVSLEGYLAAALFGEALKKQGKDITVETFVDTLEGLKDVDLGIGPTLGFSSNDHQASHTVRGTEMDANCGFAELDL